MNRATKTTRVFTTCIFTLILLSAGCTKDVEFDGSFTANETQFILDFEVLNVTKTHTMALDSSDIVDVVIAKDKGTLDISVTDTEGHSIYTGDDASSGQFALEITRSDTYEFKVTGTRAKGKVSFILR